MVSFAVLLCVASYGAGLTVNEERSFTVATSFEGTCHAIVSSKAVQSTIDRYRPTYVCQERWPAEGRARLHAKIPNIRSVVDVVLSIEVQREPEGCTVILRAAGGVARLVGRRIIATKARKEFRVGLLEQEVLIKKELGLLLEKGGG